MLEHGAIIVGPQYRLGVGGDVFPMSSPLHLGLPLHDVLWFPFDRLRLYESVVSNYPKFFVERFAGLLAVLVVDPSKRTLSPISDLIKRLIGY